MLLWAVLCGVSFFIEVCLTRNFNYEIDKIRGVNLGGWLVLEPWITPSLFKQFEKAVDDEQAVDEYTFCKILGYEKAKQQLTKHWNSWVTENDIALLASYGINHLRIPIGYWAIDTKPHEYWVQGAFLYLVKAIEWAEKYDLKVLVDVHGLPGSQNGFDNSGVRGDVNLFKHEENMYRSLAVVEFLAEFFASDEYRYVVTSIQPVNEPAGFHLPYDKIRSFYQQSLVRIMQASGLKYLTSSGLNKKRKATFRSISQKLLSNEKKQVSIGWLAEFDILYELSPKQNQTKKNDFFTVIHDAFLPLYRWEKAFPRNMVMVDTHFYHVFDINQLKLSYTGHLEMTCHRMKDIEYNQKNHMNIIVGEFSLAITDCAKWLNGFARGARYDGTWSSNDAMPQPVCPKCSCKQDSNITTFTQSYRSFLRLFAESQFAAWERGNGWFFWNFKTEQEPQWDYMMGVREGWIPTNFNGLYDYCNN